MLTALILETFLKAEHIYSNLLPHFIPFPRSLFRFFTWRARATYAGLFDLVISRSPCPTPTWRRGGPSSASSSPSPAPPGTTRADLSRYLGNGLSSTVVYLYASIYVSISLFIYVTIFPPLYLNTCSNISFAQIAEGSYHEPCTLWHPFPPGGDHCWAGRGHAGQFLFGKCRQRPTWKTCVTSAYRLVIQSRVGRWRNHSFILVQQNVLFPSQVYL